MVPDLVWMIVKNHNTTKSTSSEISEPHRHDPILGHSQPKFPQKFLKPPSPQTIPFEEISIVWTTVIITTIHLLFEFVRWKSQYLNILISSSLKYTIFHSIIRLSCYVSHLGSWMKGYKKLIFLFPFLLTSYSSLISAILADKYR